MPFGWIKSTEEDGKTIYIQQETGNKTYVDPRLAFAQEEKKHVHDFRQRFDASSTAFQVTTLIICFCHAISSVGPLVANEINAA